MPRVIDRDAEPTGAQLNFLRSLHDQRVTPNVLVWDRWCAQLRATDCWKRGEISDILDVLQDRPIVQQQPSTGAFTNSLNRLRTAHGNRGRRELDEAWAIGVHVLDDRIYRVSSHPRSRSLRVHRMSVRLSDVNAVRQSDRARWIRTTCYQNAWRNRSSDRYVTYGPDFTDATLLTVEQAHEIGARFGICARCGRLLTDPNSIERGIGPVCIRALRLQTQRALDAQTAARLEAVIEDAAPYTQAVAALSEAMQDAGANIDALARAMASVRRVMANEREVVGE